MIELTTHDYYPGTAGTTTGGKNGNTCFILGKLRLRLVYCSTGRSGIFSDMEKDERKVELLDHTGHRLGTSKAGQ